MVAPITDENLYAIKTVVLPAPSNPTHARAADMNAIRARLTEHAAAINEGLGSGGGSVYVPVVSSPNITGDATVRSANVITSGGTQRTTYLSLCLEFTPSGAGLVTVTASAPDSALDETIGLAQVIGGSTGAAASVDGDEITIETSSAGTDPMVVVVHLMYASEPTLG